MQLICPTCGARYDVPDDAVGANGRRVRCRACDTSWYEPGRTRPEPVSIPTPIEPPPSPVAVEAPPAPTPVAGVSAATAQPVPPAAVPARPRRRRGGAVPWLLLALGMAVVGLGAVAAMLAFGPDTVAARLGLAEQRVPLGIALTRDPDWQLIAGGSQLFAVSGRIWNPTGEAQAVPDLRAELKDRAGRVVYAWTIARPVARLAPGASATFDGAAVNVPASSARVSVSFAGADRS